MRKTGLLISAVVAVALLGVAACGGSLDTDDGPAALDEAPGQGLPRMGPQPGVLGGADGGGTGAGGVSAESDSYTNDSDNSGAQTSLIDRKIIRTAELSLTVENVGQAVSDVERIANTAGGFVSESQVTRTNPQDDEEEPRQTATVTIRVPAETYPSVMNQLRGIAEEVRSESSNTSEVTEEYTDLQSRLRTLEATEERYLDLLSQAETIQDILTVQDRLNSVRTEIEGIQGRLNLLDDLTDLATITVRLDLPPLPAQTSEAESKGWAQEAWDSAWATSEDALQVIGTAGIALGVLAIWLAVPGAVALIAWRLVSSRRAA